MGRQEEPHRTLGETVSINFTPRIKSGKRRHRRTRGVQRLHEGPAAGEVSGVRDRVAAAPPQPRQRPPEVQERTSSPCPCPEGRVTQHSLGRKENKQPGLDHWRLRFHSAEARQDAKPMSSQGRHSVSCQDVVISTS